MANYAHEIFPTTIWGFTAQFAPGYLEKVATTIIEMSKVLPNRDRSNFLGWQSHDDLYKYDWVQNIIRPIMSTANSEILEKYKEFGETPFELESMWANVNLPNAFNMGHIHGAEISGVFYVKVPEKDSGRLVLVDPRTRVNMSEKRLRALNFPVDPKEGTFVLFPSWLEHYVEPNQSDDIRISISFNLK